MSNQETIQAGDIPQKDVERDLPAASLEGIVAQEVGRKGIELVQMPDGSIETADRVQQMRESGQEISGPYGSSGRRS